MLWTRGIGSAWARPILARPGELSMVRQACPRLAQAAPSAAPNIGPGRLIPGTGDGIRQIGMCCAYLHTFMHVLLYCNVARGFHIWPVQQQISISTSTCCVSTSNNAALCMWTLFAADFSISPADEGLLVEVLLLHAGQGWQPKMCREVI